MASAVNNDVARAAALIAVAVLPAAAGITGDVYLHPDQFSQGFHTAVLIAGGLCVAGGLLAAVTIINPRRAEPGRGVGVRPRPAEPADAAGSAVHYCVLDARPCSPPSHAPRRETVP
jgi:hypothetical protein